MADVYPGCEVFSEERHTRIGISFIQSHKELMNCRTNAKATPDGTYHVCKRSKLPSGGPPFPASCCRLFHWISSSSKIMVCCLRKSCRVFWCFSDKSWRNKVNPIKKTHVQEDQELHVVLEMVIKFIKEKTGNEHHYYWWPHEIQSPEQLKDTGEEKSNMSR